MRSLFSIALASCVGLAAAQSGQVKAEAKELLGTSKGSIPW